MSKKIIIIILSSLILIGAFVGVYFYNDSTADDKQPAPTESEATAATEEETDEFMDEDTGYEEIIVETEVVSDKSDEFIPSDDNLSDNTDEVITTTFKIAKIIDHTNGQEVQPRVVFGTGFNMNDNYIKFDSDFNFEMYFSGFLTDSINGTFVQYEDVIYVEYEDGTSSEYNVTYTDSGTISHIIVNYGDYDIYFA